MEEVEKQDSIPEVVTPSTDAAQEIVAKEAAPIEEKENHNWRELRRQKDEWERKARMQEELLQKVMTSQQTIPAPAVAEEDFIHDIAKEEYVPGEKVARGFKKLEDRFSKQLKEIEDKYKHQAYVGRISELKRDYADLEDVVNPETLQLVKQKNPRLAETWVGMDDYTLYVQAYPYIKDSGILDEIPGMRRVKEVEKKLEQNKKTVQSPAAFEKRPMAQAFDMTRLSEEQKKEIQKEMYHFASLAGGY